MTTKKAYQTQNAQQVYNDARNDSKLFGIVNKAWGICEDIDPYVEWGDNDVSNLIDALRESSNGTVADQLELALATAYGTDEVEVADYADWSDWGMDW